MTRSKLKGIVVAGWSIVFAGWAVGIFLDRAPAKEVVANRWRCRLYGFTAATALLASAVDWRPVRFRSPRWLALPLLPAFLGGMALYYWARLSLRQNWSSEARIAENHSLVTDGAYRLVRHPIYLSKVLMALSSGLLLGNWLVVLLGLGLVGAGFYQARVEEDMLSRHFPEGYVDYSRRTGMLLPRPAGQWTGAARRLRHPIRRLRATARRVRHS